MRGRTLWQPLTLVASRRRLPVSLINPRQSSQESSANIYWCTANLPAVTTSHEIQSKTPDTLPDGSIPQNENKVHSPVKRYVDIGINLSDATFRGVYHGKQAHEDDTVHVIQRAVDIGCLKMMVTGSDLEESQKAIRIAELFPGICYATVGVHPCSAKSFDQHPGGPDELLRQLGEVASEGKQRGIVTAFGEIGLDYDRLYLTEKEQQLKYFEAQLMIATKVQLPLFLHSRAAGEDFERLIKARLPHLPKRGLVHSFTGTMEEMKNLVALDLDIGVNGCSMKTEENIEVVKEIPLERLQIETDGPWCEMRASQASLKYKDGAPELPRAVKKEKWEKDCMVKGRNEPVTISHVAYAVARIKGITVEEVCEATWRNSVEMFGLGADP